MTGRFDKFTERARKTLQLAQEEAQRFNHNYIGTEHILLGLVREGDGVAARVLNNLGIDLGKVRSSVEFIIGRGDRMVMGEIGLTPRSKRVIEFAVDEARRLNHHYIGTEHLLLGLVREGEGIAAGVLESLGVSLEKVRAQVIEVLKSSSGYSFSGSSQPPSGTPWGPGGGLVGIPAEPGTQHDDLATLAMWIALEFQVASLEHIDPSLIDALRRAATVARGLKRSYIAADNLLDSMLRNEGSAVWRLLKQRGVQPGGGFVLELEDHADVMTSSPITPMVLRIIALGIQEARSAGVKATAEHLLLGIMLEGTSTAYQALAREGITADEVRALIKGDTAGSSE